jgi:tRNA dimethylallyltransferase
LAPPRLNFIDMPVEDGSPRPSGKTPSADLLPQLYSPQPSSLRECFPSLADRAIVLTGPTASGKSAIALALARRIDAEILSLDSIAVYRHMNIGTAKPSPEDQARVRHHLIDLVDPNEMFSVSCYLQAAHATLEDLERRGRRAIFVGGTPMFLKGILRGFDPGPPADWSFRRAVEEDLARYGVEALRDRLRQVDPLAAHRIDPGDTRRMIRALEVAWQTGVPLSHRQTQFDHARPAAECQAFVLQVARDQLHRQIKGRVERMFADGLINEIRGLLERYGTLSKTASQAVGYREVIDWLEHSGDLGETQEAVVAHTRRLARRQETWFRSFRELTPLETGNELDARRLADQIALQLGL